MMPDGFKPVFRRANVGNRKRIKALERRQEYLEDLIRRRQAKDFDKAEAKALAWIIPIAQKWMESDPVIDVDVTPEEFSGQLDEWVSLYGTTTLLDTGETILICEIVGVNPQDQRLALLVEDGSRPVKEGPLSGKTLGLKEAADGRVSL